MARANALYYASHDPFADFATAPEIGQVFGELLGAWAVITWQQLGSPAPFILAELGPGRGTLMADARRLARRVAPAFAAAARLHLVESSPRLRAEQARALPDATWHDDLAGLPPGPLILLANEFLDALPIRQLVRRAAGWMERHVAPGAAGAPSTPGAAGTPAAAPSAPGTFVERLTAPLGLAAPLDAVVEVGEAAQQVAALLGARLACSGGVALLIDYGHTASAPGETLQALRHGQPADPLADPGEADLTAHVDFAALAHAAKAGGAATHGPITQAALLGHLGIAARTAALARARPDKAETLAAAQHRLCHPDQMGTLFKALALTAPNAPTPPGFENAGLENAGFEDSGFATSSTKTPAAP